MAKMTKKQRSLAAKKAARTRRRNANKPKRRRRRRTRKNKGFLSAPSSAENQEAFKTMTSGAVGGGLYLVYEDQVDLGANSTPEKKAALAALGSYFLAAWGKKPKTAAGVVGAAAYDFFKTKGLLNDPADVQMSRMEYADPLQNVPVMLNDDEMYLQQGGDEMYLQEDGNGEMYLQEGGLFSESGYMPNYAEPYGQY